MNFVSNIIWNSVEGFVEAGTRTAGGYAGDALIKAGDLIESGGRGVGTKIERTVSGYGTKISGEGYQGSNNTAASGARKTPVKRSNSSPASTKAGSRTAIGQNKYPGGRQVTGAVGGAQKQAQKTIGGVTGGVTGGATNSVRGAAGGGRKALTAGAGNAQNSVGGTLGGVNKGVGGALGGVTGGAQKTLSGVGAARNTTTKAPLPKPFPTTQQPKVGNSPLPKPYPNSTSAYPGAEKRTAVKPGQPKEFKAPAGVTGVTGIGAPKVDAKKAYPGTNTLPGQGKKTPVRNTPYKPAPLGKPMVTEGKVQSFF